MIMGGQFFHTLVQRADEDAIAAVNGKVVASIFGEGDDLPDDARIKRFLAVDAAIAVIDDRSLYEDTRRFQLKTFKEMIGCLKGLACCNDDLHAASDGCFQ